MEARILACTSFVVAWAVTSCGREPAQAPTGPTVELTPVSSAAKPVHSSGEAQVTAGGEDVKKGVRLLELGDLAGAKRSFQQALKVLASAAEAHAYLGIVAEREGDKKGAESHYVDALKLRPDLEAASANLSALYTDLGMFADAANVARAGIAKHPDNAPLHLNAAVAMASAGDPLAQSQFEEAVRRAPKDPVYLLTYAHWLGVWKRNNDAIAKLKQVETLVPTGVDGLGILAAIGHELRLVGAFTDCTRVMDKSLALREAAELRTDRALCKLGQKDEAGAQADLEMAVQKEPNYAPAHFYLGGRLAARGRWKDVVSEYETYLKLASDGPMKNQALERVKLAKEKLSAASSSKSGGERAGTKGEKK